jgi:DNA-binding GntR family transcriptional regulator
VPRSQKAKSKKKSHLAAELAAAIRSGAFRPGEWLRQIDLERQFGATRFDVRTALTELSLRGSVEHFANRGYRVAAPDAGRLAEMRVIRSLLEVEAAVTALPYIRGPALAEIKTLAARFEREIAEGDIVAQARANAAFHDAIYRHAPNRTLIELVVEMRDRGRRWPIALWSSHAGLLRSAADHTRIVAAIEARDPIALATEVRDHIIGSSANISESDDPGKTTMEGGIRRAHDTD